MAPSHKIQGNSRIIMKLGEMHESAVKFWMNPKNIFVTSFVTLPFVTNSSGPRTLPWGMPLITGAGGL